MAVSCLASVDGPLSDFLGDPWGALCAGLTSAGAWVQAWGPLAVPLGVFVVGGVWWAYRRWRAFCLDSWHAQARVVIIESPPSVQAEGARSLWANLVGLLLRPAGKRVLFGTPAVSWEYVFTAAGVAIRLWVPGTVAVSQVQRAVEAAWPGARTRTDENTPPLSAAADSGRRVVATGGTLRLARPEALPIRTDLDHTDPLRALLAAPGQLTAGDGACVQVLARPATGRRLARAQATRSPAAGGNHAASAFTLLTRGLLDLLTPGSSTATSRPASGQQRPGAGRDPRVGMEVTAQNRAMVDKQQALQCASFVRYVVTTTVPTDASEQQVAAAQAQLRGRAHALASACTAYSAHNYYRRHRLREPLRAVGRRWLGSGDLLSVAELAALAHLPTDAATPGLARAGAKAVPPPAGIATGGAQVKPLGVSDVGEPHPVGLRVADARQHLHVLGATGSGKSTLLARMILDDATHRRGTVVIDPKGDLVTDVLGRLPREAAGRVVLFDADQPGTVPCVNPLQGGDRDLTVDNLVSVFRRVHAAFWGPRTDDVFRAACLTLRAQAGVSTLADVPRLLDETAFRRRVTASVTDPVLRGFWSWYENLTESARSQAIAPLMNKLRAFLLRPFVRDALAGGQSTVDMSQVLDGGICLVRIPKGSLGEETTRLIGSLIVARVWQATTARANTPHRQRHDASMVLDECHNFLNMPYPLEDMLAEARGFRLSMTLAHQHLGQLGRELREGLSTNARSKIFFTAGPDDARELSRHTAPRVTEHDLAHLGAFHAAARLLIRDEETDPFTLSTEPLPAVVPGRARHIRAHAPRAVTNQAGSEAPAGADETTGSSPDPHPNTSAAPTPPTTSDPTTTAAAPDEAGPDPGPSTSDTGSTPASSADPPEPDEILLEPDARCPGAPVWSRTPEAATRSCSPQHRDPRLSEPE